MQDFFIRQAGPVDAQYFLPGSCALDYRPQLVPERAWLKNCRRISRSQGFSDLSKRRCAWNDRQDLFAHRQKYVRTSRCERICRNTRHKPQLQFRFQLPPYVVKIGAGGIQRGVPNHRQYHGSDMLPAWTQLFKLLLQQAVASFRVVYHRKHDRQHFQIAQMRPYHLFSYAWPAVGRVRHQHQVCIFDRLKRADGDIAGVAGTNSNYDEFQTYHSV
jgi:hypothetical protein